MENEECVIRKRGGGCIVNHPPWFSKNLKYVYVLTGNSISAYSVLSGECTHQYIVGADNEKDLVCLASNGDLLFSATADGSVIIWNTDNSSSKKVEKLPLEPGTSIVDLHPTSCQGIDKFNFVAVLRNNNIKNSDELELYYLTVKDGQNSDLRKLYVRAEDISHSISASVNYVAAINEDRLCIVPLTKKEKKTSLLAGGGRKWTVVRWMPDDKGLAAGDNSGRIVVWPLPNCPQTRAVFHWHTLPVRAIAFSPSGSYMYSGGGEGVMVRWNMEGANLRSFLPRLPAPILQLAVSSDNQCLAIATEDNGIQLADAQNRVNRLIQKFSWGTGSAMRTSLFPVGLVWDPRSRSIILNGRPGHLQFFQTDANRLLYNLDITNENYLSAERNKETINAELTHVAISYDGKWMVTVEKRDDNETYLETLLKFWQYQFNSREFRLNTCVQGPHQKGVNAIKFQPRDTLTDQYLMVSTGADLKFRIWTTPIVPEANHTEGAQWICDGAETFRDMSPKCIAFSGDGSLLGVTFGPSLTLWDLDTREIKTSLTRHKSDIKAVEFGCQESRHLVVTINKDDLYVWSITSCCVIWTVPMQASVLAVDPFSPNMAVFSNVHNTLFVFSPLNPKLVYIKKELSPPGVQVEAAVFVPRLQKLMGSRGSWLETSQLHFIDSNKELKYVELKREPDPETVQAQQWTVIDHTDPITPFNVLAAETSTAEVHRPEDFEYIQFGNSVDAAVRELLKYSHQVLPIHMLCAPFLRGLLVTRETDSMDIDDDPVNVADDRKSVNEDNSSCDEVSTSFSGQSQRKKLSDFFSK